MDTIHTIHRQYTENTRRPSEVIDEALNTIQEKDETINAFLQVFEDQVYAQAKELDAKQDRGEEFGPLEGIPVSIKDAILAKGEPTTAGSKILQSYTAVYDASVIHKLRKEGAFILGKTNMDEFAMGSSTENSAFAPTRNPHDTSRVPGGSSGGSAAAVAAEMSPAALGSDTGGSIRQPAAFCGVTGLKPTYGRVSRSGLIAMASSLDQIGPFTKTSLDAGYVLKGIEGKDTLDATSVHLSARQQIDLDEVERGDVAGLRIGVPQEYFTDGIQPEVKQKLEEVIATFTDMKVVIKDISLETTQFAIPAYYIIMPAEVSSNLARYDGIRYGMSSFENAGTLHEVYTQSRARGFGTEVMRRIMLGTYVLSGGYYDAYYAQARNTQTKIRKDFDTAFEDVDVILAPTTPHQAFPLGEKSDPLSMYLEDIFTVAVNLSGNPAISVPANPESSELPIGFQLIGNHFDEQTILTLGHAWDRTLSRQS